MCIWLFQTLNWTVIWIRFFNWVDCGFAPTFLSCSNNLHCPMLIQYCINSIICCIILCSSQEMGLNELQLAERFWFISLIRIQFYLNPLNFSGIICYPGSWRSHVFVCLPTLVISLLFWIIEITSFLYVCPPWALGRVNKRGINFFDLKKEDIVWMWDLKYLQGPFGPT